MKVLKMENPTSIEKFGKDHASLLAYFECVCVDKKGEIDGSRIRVNTNRHPVFGDRGRMSLMSMSWQDSWCTRLRNGEKAQPWHDDVDIMDELEHYGYIEFIGTMVNPYVRMTELGNKTAHKIRIHKSNGGTFSTFKDWN